MSNVTKAPKCSRCGTVLAPDVPERLCPRCLLALNLATETEMPAGEVDSEATAGAKWAAGDPPSLAEVAKLFPQLEVLGLLGKGGMGAVYKARQPALDRFVALKLLPPQADAGAGFAERFNREARALARLSHPNIVAVHEFGQLNGQHYFVMEFVDGVNLRQLQRSGRLSAREALQIVPQICDALQYAHDEGVVHRDIKPENVLVDRKGRVKIADFGLAKILGREATDRPLTGEGQVMGTPHYMAPEQVEHPLEVDHRADIYSLGVVFYEMLTGELPLGKFAPPSRKVQVDVRLDEVVLHALEKEPERRYQQASQVKSDVETLKSLPPQASPPATPSPSWEFARRRVRPLATALFVLGTLGLIVSTLVQIRGHGPTFLDVSLGTFWYWRWFLPEGWSPFLALFETPLQGLYLLVIVGAWRMRRLENLGLAIAAAACAMIIPPLLPFGLPLGACTLAVLARKEIRREFATVTVAGDSSSTTSLSFSKLAVAGAVLTVVSMLSGLLQTAGVLLDWGRGHAAGSPSWLVAVCSILFWGWPYLGNVVLGIIALEDIRCAHGRLKGAGFAVFSLLFIPLNVTVSRLIQGTPGSTDTLTDRVGVGLLAEIIALVCCGGVALWVQHHENQRLRLGFPQAGWLLLRPAVRALQLSACGLVVLNLSLSGAFRVWTDLKQRPSQIDLNAFASHARAHASLVTEGPVNHLATPSPDGDLELVAVSDVSSASPVCWQPDGVVFCKPTDSRPERTGPDKKPRSLILNLRFLNPSPLVDVASLAFELRIAGKVVASRGSFGSGNEALIAFSAPQEASQLDFRVAVPANEWQDTDAGWEWKGRIPRHPERVIRRSGQQAEVLLTQAEDNSNGALIVWVTRSFPANWAGRLVAVDHDGNVHEPDRSYMSSLRDTAVAGWRGEMTTFNGLVLSQIKELRFQIRQCRWMEFRNVSLQPGVKTPVEVVDVAE
jgi:predicted Ser/Thr protein kinase